MYNYHTHTYRCGHACGSDEEYVLKAIEANYTELGFTDHVMLPGIKRNYVRAGYEQKDEYLKAINALKEKYQDKINIYVGFECEWDNHYENYYRQLLLNQEVDYLIFGNHSCYFKGGIEHGLKITSYKRFLNRYQKHALAAIRSGLFKIMAHPDIYMSSVPWNNDAKKVANIICQEAKKYDVILELNCGCFINEEKRQLFNEYRYRYPYGEFWKTAKKHGNKIVVGIDAHNPTAFISNKKQLMNEFIEKYKLTIEKEVKI